MNEGLWVLVGVLLGFVGTYLLQRLAENRRKKHLRAVARNIIGLEVIHNLRIIETINETTAKTIKDMSFGFYKATVPPRSEVFNRLLDLPSLSVLDASEQRGFVEVFSQLNIVAREFALWPGSHDSCEAASQRLLNYTTILRRNLVMLLCEICFGEKEGLQEEQLRGIYHKLQIIERDRKTQAYLGKSSDYKNTNQKGSARYLVVWEHDWTECPLEVIELRPSQEDTSS